MKVNRAGRALAAATSALIVIVGLATPASAAQWDRADRVGDGYDGGDISHLNAANRAHEVYVKVSFDDLERTSTGDMFLVIDTDRHDGYDYMLFTSWTGRHFKNVLDRAVPFSDAPAHQVDCPAMTVRWMLAKDAIVLRVPQRCLLRPSDRVRVGFYSGNDQGTHDDWAPGGFARNSRWLARG